VIRRDRPAPQIVFGNANDRPAHRCKLCNWRFGQGARCLFQFAWSQGGRGGFYEGDPFDRTVNIPCHIV